MASIQLDDLVYTYPNQNDDDFQTKISAKKEFYELSSNLMEPIPKRGEFYNHQVFVHRFLNKYDRLLITSSPGTGKTGSVIGFAESLREKMVNNVYNFVLEYIIPKKTHIKGVIYLVKNKPLMDQIKNDILCKYSKPGTYESEKIVEKGKSEAAQKSRITREISKFYKIRTFKKFAKDIYTENYSDQQIIDQLSGYLYIFDEVHNIRIEYKEEEDDYGVDADIIEARRDKKIRQQKQIYDTYWRVFHLIKRSKIVLMTATPMINSAEEISKIVNLILPLNRQMPTNREFFANATEEELRPYFTGIISYVGESDTFAIPVEEGDLLNKKYKHRGVEITSTQKIYMVEMLNEIKLSDGQIIDGQAKIYDRISNAGDRNNSFRGKERQAANFVFPDGTFGDSGISRYEYDINDKKEKINGRWVGGPWILNRGNEIYDPSKELYPWIANLDNLRTISAKFYEIIKIVNQRDGNIFIFSPFKNGGGGALSLGMCLKYHGYEQFNETENIFVSQGGSGPQRSGCKTHIDQSDQPETGFQKRLPRKIRQNFPKKPRFAIITSGMSPSSKMDLILEIFNSWENRHGEYIKILIATPIVREGINTANVLTYINLGPEWNASLSFQAKYRVLRAISHEDLLDELREKAIIENRDPNLVKIYVNIINLAAIDPNKKTSVDIDMYITSEDKDISIKFIENVMRKEAIDAQIHAARNQISRTSDKFMNYFGSHSYYGKEPVKPDLSSYNVLYIEHDIDEIINYIKNIYRTKFSLSLNELLTLLNTYPKKFPLSYIQQAIERLITTKEQIIDRFGFHGYIQEKGHQFYIQREYPVRSNTSRNNIILDYYSENLFGISINNLIDFTNKLKSASTEMIEENILKTDPDTTEWDKQFDTLSDESKIKVFEKAFTQIIESTTNPAITITPAIQKIYKMYERRIYVIYEPLAFLQLITDRINKRGTTRGRKPKEGKIPELKQLKITDDMIKIPTLDDPGVGGRIYLHTIYGVTVDRSSYSVSANLGRENGRIRLYRQGSEWRDITMIEMLAYNAIINKIINDKLMTFEQLPFYGILSSVDGAFRIRYTAMERDEADNDKRYKNRGRNADYFKVDQLAYFMYTVQVPLPSHPATYYEQVNYLSRYNLPLNDFTLDQIDYYYRVYTMGERREQMGERIKKRLMELGWIYIE